MVLVEWNPIPWAPISSSFNPPFNCSFLPPPCFQRTVYAWRARGANYTDAAPACRERESAKRGTPSLVPFLPSGIGCPVNASCHHGPQMPRVHVFQTPSSTPALAPQNLRQRPVLTSRVPLSPLHHSADSPSGNDSRGT